MNLYEIWTIQEFEDTNAMNWYLMFSLKLRISGDMVLNALI